MKRAQLTHLPLSKIRAGRNVRVTLPDIDGLAESLLQHGMLQPITVVPTDDGEDVEVLFGHRRLAAAKKAGLQEVPCFLRLRGDEQDRLLAQAAENFDRADMTPLDEARLYGDLGAAGMTQTEIAARVRRSQAHVSRHMRLLNYPESVQFAVNDRRITIHDALGIPISLLAKPAARGSLDKALVSAPALRSWIERHLGQGAIGARASLPYWSMRLHQRFRDVARAASKRSGIPIADWVELAIIEKAERQ